MGAARRKNTLESDSLVGLPSEVCGYKDGIYYAPKSFKNFGIHKNNCYNGLFYLLGNFKNSKDFKIYKGLHTPESKLKDPLIIQIYISLFSVLQELRNSPISKFNKRKEYSSPYRGKIDFNKTILKNLGLLHKTFKSVNEINHRSLERNFLFFAIKKIPSLIYKFASEDTQKDFDKVISECLFHIQEIDNSNQDLADLSFQILCKPVELGINSKLLSHCKVIADFLVSNIHYTNSSVANHASLPKIEFNDFHLNLNRPFERLLQAICQKLPQSDVPQKKFSNIQSNISYQRETGLFQNNDSYEENISNAGEFKHSLIPDVWKILNLESNSKETEPCLLILDAKHKEFANVNTSDFEFDPFVQYNRITRNDLHQLITYIRTNLINNSCGIFGFFGFIQENLTENAGPDYVSSFIDCNRDTRAKSNPLVLSIEEYGEKKQIFINILGLRFGSVLSLIGEACEKRKAYPMLLDDIYSRLAIELTHCLFKDTVLERNDTLAKTINNCLSGACRSLFFIYEGKANFLSEIGMHLAKLFLKHTQEVELVSPDIKLILRGSVVHYVEVSVAKNFIVFVIDSSEDPMQIYHSQMGSRLFDRNYFEYVAIMTRDGLIVYRDGVVAQNPSVLLNIEIS